MYVASAQMLAQTIQTLSNRPSLAQAEVVPLESSTSHCVSPVLECLLCEVREMLTLSPTAKS